MASQQQTGRGVTPIVCSIMAKPDVPQGNGGPLNCTVMSKPDVRQGNGGPITCTVM